MLKVWRLTTVFSSVLFPFLPGIGLGYPKFVDVKSQVVAQVQRNSLVCYMQTADGQTVDLTTLCGQQSLPTVSPPRLSAAASETTKMPISDVRYDGNILSGQITNQTGDTVQNVKVNYEVRDRQGNTIDNGFISAQPSTIPPGGSASFSGMTVKGATVQPTFVEWGNR
jgi:hypothetical protein